MSLNNKLGWGDLTMSSESSSKRKHEQDSADFVERCELSLSCTIVLWVGHLIQKLTRRSEHWISPSIIVIALFPLGLILPSAFTEQSPISTVNRFTFAIWPTLLVLSTTTFSWQATKHLCDSARLFTSLLRDANSCDSMHEWRRFFRTGRQVLVALLIGSFGAIGGFIIVRRLGVDMIVSVLGAFSLFISGSLGGLAFYIGAVSPVLTYRVSRCEFDLHPFAPATTPEIREIAWNYGRIVFKGMIVGVVLSSPLLYLVAHYTIAPLRSLFVIAIVPAWLVVFLVFGSVQYNLYKIISKTKTRTRAHLHLLIKRAYETLDHAKSDEMERLKDLLDLDRTVLTSSRLVIDARVVLQAISSLITAVIPLGIQLLIGRYRG